MHMFRKTVNTVISYHQGAAPAFWAQYLGPH